MRTSGGKENSVMELLPSPSSSSQFNCSQKLGFDLIERQQLLFHPLSFLIQFWPSLKCKFWSDRKTRSKFQISFLYAWHFASNQLLMTQVKKNFEMIFQLSVIAELKYNVRLFFPFNRFLVLRQKKDTQGTKRLLKRVLLSFLI